MKKFGIALCIGIVCGLVTFAVIMMLNALLPTSGSLQTASIAGICMTALCTAALYFRQSR